jgi:hypothetical protein
MIGAVGNGGFSEAGVAAGEVPIPGARLLLDQMVRLSDYHVSSIDELQQKSRAYLGIGALAITVTAAFLASSDVEPALAVGAGAALLLFGLSAYFAVRAERATYVDVAPASSALTALVTEPSDNWSDDQLVLWVAREFADTIVPQARKQVERIALQVNLQLYLFLAEVVVIGGTLIAAIVG